jgi:osmotically-inducible protein OsmY
MVSHALISGEETQHDLARRVRNQLHRRPELRRVSVQVEDGTVTLDGYVASFYLKQLCISGSQCVPGVYRLDDRIRVQ